jgi:23S rRNA (uracil1939-C5)-methyltransferase
MGSGLVQVDIGDLTAEGSGVGRLPDGRAVFVPWTAPGDRAQIRVVEERERWARGELESLTEPGESRRDPRCALYEQCGGCRLQHVRYRDQVEWKARRIREALRRIGDREVEEPPVEASDREWGYRNRMSFTLKRLRNGRVVAGLHRFDAPGRVLDVRDECLLPEEPVLGVWVGLRDVWGPGARRLPPGGSLRLTLRNASEGVVLQVEGGEVGGDAPALLEGVEGLVSVAHRPRNGEWRHLAGLERTRDRSVGEDFEVSAGAFLQVNRPGGEALHRSVLGEIGNPAGMRVVDAYCGVGAYGRRLARHGAEVVGIELDEGAAREAARDAPEGLRVVRGRVEEHLDAHLPADRVILNPPRVGLGERVGEVLRERPVARVLYISCDPATLARDLKRMGPGYAVRRVRGFDLFPQTPHVETVVTLDAITHGKA